MAVNSVVWTSDSTKRDFPVKFEFLMVVFMEVAVFWDMTPWYFVR
jgi:hypothetical protein